MPYKNINDKKANAHKYYLANKDKLISNAKQYWIEHRDIGIKRCKKRYKSHKSEYIQAAKDWATANPEKRRKIENKYQRTHKSISRLLRQRLRCALQGISRPLHTMELLGCSMSKLKEHLQKTAVKNGYTHFCIDNYDSRKYHIDHIIPCAEFDLNDIDQQKKCFHWSNLQILDAKANRLKSDSLIKV